MEYNENHAIAYIRQIIGEHISKEHILAIIDAIWDFYEECGLLDISIDDMNDDVIDEEVNIDELISYVKNVICNDINLQLDLTDVERIVLAELDYEKTLEEF